MDQDTGNNRQQLQRDYSRIKKKEKYHKNRSRPPGSTTAEKAKHHRRFKRTITHNITNLSKHQLTPGETSLFSKGLNIIPKPHKEHPATLLQDILLFDRNLRLKYYFHQDTLNESTESTESTEEEDTTHSNILHPSSGWSPPSRQDPFLESYKSTIQHNTMKEIKKNSKQFKKNLKKKEWQAITTLKNNNNIVIKQADKGGNIVIMNKQDYIQEGLRQLSNSNHYEILKEDPTWEYNNQMYQVLQQAVNLNIIDDKTMKTIYNKSPGTPNFYMLHKIHKANNPGIPIVNAIWSITERISA